MTSVEYILHCWSFHQFHPLSCSMYPASHLVKCLMTKHSHDNCIVNKAEVSHYIAKPQVSLGCMLTEMILLTWIHNKLCTFSDCRNTHWSVLTTPQYYYLFINWHVYCTHPCATYNNPAQAVPLKVWVEHCMYSMQIENKVHYVYIQVMLH